GDVAYCREALLTGLRDREDRAVGAELERKHAQPLRLLAIQDLQHRRVDGQGVRLAVGEAPAVREVLGAVPVKGTGLFLRALHCSPAPNLARNFGDASSPGPRRGRYRRS